MSSLEKIQAEYAQFPEVVQSLMLATTSPEGLPNASYAPFVCDEAKNFYIYVSGLAQHTQNLEAQPRASILLIEDEGSAQQVFARSRLSYDCTAIAIARETPEWEHIVAQFQARFGDIIDLLRSLPDFRIFKLAPQSGRFVVGFGAIYAISGENRDRLQPVQQ